MSQRGTGEEGESENENENVPASARRACSSPCSAAAVRGADLRGVGRRARATRRRDTADVVYAEEDDGKYSDDTALQRRGWEREWQCGREESDDEPSDEP